MTPVRLLLPIILTALGGIVMLVVTGALWIIQNNSTMLAQYQLRDAHLIAGGLANAVAPELVSKDYGALEERLLQTASDPNVHSALVIDMQGQVLGNVRRRSSDEAAHAVFDLQKMSPPQSEQTQNDEEQFLLIVWHVVKVGMDVGWVRVEIATNYYARSMDKIRREVWGLALVVMVAGCFLLGAAILRSHKLLSQREEDVRNQQHLLENKAYYDALTQLPNRALLLDRFTQAMARSARNLRILAVCFVDLDEFKPINDSYGHEAGDCVLIEVARRLQSAVRGDDTVARIGGDEFVVLLGDIENVREAELAVSRLHISLLDSFIHDGRKIELRASIGYALYPEDSGDVETLLNFSDQAMYLAKSSGGNRIGRHRPPSVT